MIWAQWLSTMVFTAALRSGSWQLRPATYSMLAPGAIACDGLDVEGLLAVPAGGVALVDEASTSPGRDWANW